MPERADEAMMASDDIRDDTRRRCWRRRPHSGRTAGWKAARPRRPVRRAPPRARPGGRRPDRLPDRVLPAGRPRGPDRGRPGSAGRDGRQARRARREPPAGPPGRRRPPGPVERRGRRRPHQRRDRRRHRHRRHAVPGRLGDDGAQPARRRHPADRAPGAHACAGTWPGTAPRDRRGWPATGRVRESWIHVELGQVADEQRLADDLRRVLDDLRVAMEDQRRMRGAARELVEVLTDEGGSEEAEASELLAWLSAGHFTFLGYRKYDLVRSVEGDGAGRGRAQAGARHRTWHPPARRHRLVRRHPAQGPGGPAPGAAARAGQVVHPVHRLPARASWTTWRSARSSQATGEVTGEYRFLGLYTQAAFTESITRIPVLRRKLDAVLAAAGLPEDSHDGKALIEILEGYPREELFEISAEQLTPIAPGGARARRAQAGPPLPAPRRLRPVRVLPGLPAQGPVHHPGQAARPGDPAQRPRRRLGATTARWSATRRWPGCTWWCTPPRAIRWPRSTRPRCRRGSRPRSAPGTRTSPPRPSASSAPTRAAALLRTCGRRHPRDLQGRHHPGPGGGGSGGGAAVAGGRRHVRHPPFD